jgi:hypothetical protein
LAIAGTNPERLATLAHEAKRINADVITPPEMASATIRQTWREIFQHYQPKGSTLANTERNGERLNRLKRIGEALDDPKLARLSASSAAAHLSSLLGLSPHTLRKDIAEIRKLTGPTS